MERHRKRLCFITASIQVKRGQKTVFNFIFSHNSHKNIPGGPICSPLTTILPTVAPFCDKADVLGCKHQAQCGVKAEQNCYASCVAEATSLVQKHLKGFPRGACNSLFLSLSLCPLDNVEATTVCTWLCDLSGWHEEDKSSPMDR